MKRTREEGEVTYHVAGLQALVLAGALALTTFAFAAQDTQDSPEQTSRPEQVVPEAAQEAVPSQQDAQQQEVQQQDAAQGDPTKQRVEVELISIRPTGFHPAEITRPHGKFLLVVYNNTDLNQVGMRLTRTTGSGEREVDVPRGRRKWRDILNLPPGEYMLTAPDHPDWVCRITLTPN